VEQIQPPHNNAAMSFINLKIFQLTTDTHKIILVNAQALKGILYRKAVEAAAHEDLP